MEVCARFELIVIENATALGHDVLELGKRPGAQMIGHRHRQLDWHWSREGMRGGEAHEGLCQSAHAGDRGPGLEGLGPGGSILVGGEVIAAEVEQVVDPIVRGEEALGLTG